MSAVLAQPDVSPVQAARAALDAAQAELAALDARISAYQEDLDQIELQKRRNRAETITAVSTGAPLPRPPKLKSTDAEVALPILRAKRKELSERVEHAQAMLRREIVQHVERRYLDTLDEKWAKVAALAREAWSETIGLHGLLSQAGVTSHPLPPGLDQFCIPALGRLKPICEHHAMHFLASDALQSGEGNRAIWAARKRIEEEIGQALPW